MRGAHTDGTDGIGQEEVGKKTEKKIVEEEGDGQDVELVVHMNDLGVVAGSLRPHTRVA